jgi:hypothetical protein
MSKPLRNKLLQHDNLHLYKTEEYSFYLYTLFSVSYILLTTQL